jgi:diacylglycerol kinase (ATP)
MEKAVVIANPAASQFTGGAHRDVMAILNRHFEVEAIWPASGTDATRACRDAVDRGTSLVIAMGGDGMVNHVAQGLVGTASGLGIIPVGTTNVIARVFSIPGSAQKAARMLAQHRPPQPVGIIRLDLTHGSVESTHYSVFACGLGLDADVVIEADKDPYRKYRFGSVHYARTALGVALGSFPKKRPHITVTDSEREALVTAVVFQFRDVYTYFGRLPLVLSTERPDPVSALLVGRLKRRRVPLIAARIFARRDLGELAEAEIWKNAVEVSARADPPVAAQADGESLGMVDAARFTWMPEALNVYRGPSSG